MPPEPTSKSTTSSTELEDSDIFVPLRVCVELEALWIFGAVTMVTELRAGLEYLGFDTALSWVEHHPIQYVRGIERGVRSTNPDAVPDAKASKNSSRDASIGHSQISCLTNRFYDAYQIRGDF